MIYSLLRKAIMSIFFHLWTQIIYISKLYQIQNIAGARMGFDFWFYLCFLRNRSILFSVLSLWKITLLYRTHTHKVTKSPTQNIIPHKVHTLFLKKWLFGFIKGIKLNIYNMCNCKQMYGTRRQMRLYRQRTLKKILVSRPGYSLYKN